ncbi:hypothetical protein UAM5_00070 [Ralstonia phage UAM5]|nr:hypothetical protein UAM5_00070 [Ralstonia phage UAM5]
MGDSVPSSSMMRIVVQRLWNGVDRLKSVEVVPRVATFPPHARLLDLDNPRKRDLVTLGMEQVGMVLSSGAIVMGCVYDDGDDSHILAWVSQPPAGASAVQWVRAFVSEQVTCRRCIYVALLTVAFLAPSPFIDWDEVFAEPAPVWCGAPT